MRRALLALKKGDAVGQGTNPADLAALARIEALLETVLAEAQCFSLRQLAVDGRDLMALGLRGPAIGAALRTLLAHVLDRPEDNQKTILLALARRIQTGEDER